MRRVNRTPEIPGILLSKGVEEHTKASQYFGPPRESPKAFPFAIYKHQEVKLELERLFHGKCAYCETFYATSQPMDVEHFRPKGAVEGESDHTGYWWIAMAWENLLPSCIDCNRKRNQITPKGDVSQVRLLNEALRFSRSLTVGTGKKDSFPLPPGGVRAKVPSDSLASEKALLLNPCDEDPDEHLRYLFTDAASVSFVVPRPLATTDPDVAGPNGLSMKGATSIHVYGLNRVALVQARTEILRRLEFMGKLVIDMKALAEEIATGGPPHPAVARAVQALSGFADRVIAEMRAMEAPEKPYSAMVTAWRKDFAARIANPG